MEEQKCPRCGSREFIDHDCGTDSYENDVTWSADECCGCGLWYSSWRDKWLLDVGSWQEEEGAEEFAVPTLASPQ